MRLGARCEPAGHQLAARHQRLRQAGRDRRGRVQRRCRTGRAAARTRGDDGRPARADALRRGGRAGGRPEAVGTFDVTLRIRRFNPEAGAETYWEEFTVRALRTDRVLDALHTIKWEVDGSLTFRRSCAHGICGSDAMRINGRNRLACKVLLKDLDPSKPITVEPIKGLAVVKDLVVDMEPFFASYREVMPFLITGGNAPSAERRQSPEERARYDDTTKCILCAACTSSCPVFWTDGQYFGPAAIVNAHRFIFDEPVGVDDRGRPEVLPIGPEDRAGRRARGAQDALGGVVVPRPLLRCCLLYTSDAADEEDSVD